MIQLDAVITNGYIDVSTIADRIEQGWTFVATVPAKLVHPHALGTDKATIFSRHIQLHTKPNCDCNADECANGIYSDR